MKNISKTYFGNRVLKDISIKVKPGEIHALLGENGAGKSTLMNILFGMPVIYSTGGFEGEIFIEGEKVNISSPEIAMKLGIGMVHQEFMLIPGFTVTENIKLNREKTKKNISSKVFGKSLESLDSIAMKNDAIKAIKKLNVEIDENEKISNLPVGYMQFVEIAREIDKKNIKLLVFDEPTAVLTESEAETLLAAMKSISNEGIAIIFITHRLNEVMTSSDSATILRDGTLVTSLNKDDTNVRKLAELMVGRSLDMDASGAYTSKEGIDIETIENREIIMKMIEMKVDMPGEEVKGVNLDIYKGEILGIGGLAGQGKIGIANGVMGLYPTSGEIKLNGESLKLNSPVDSLKSKLAFVSEDRRGMGLLLDTSIEMNIAITALQTNDMFLRKCGICKITNKKAIRNHALNMIRDLDIRCTGPGQVVKRLSGGNQQKVCLSRAITMKPEVLFVSEPTRGIDIGAKKLVLDTLVKLNKEYGLTIVMTSSELLELKSICHRIAIITEGKIEGVVSPDADDVDFGLMMSGEYSQYGNVSSQGGEIQ